MSSVNISWEAVPGALTYSVSLASSETPELGRSLNNQVRISAGMVYYTSGIFKIHAGLKTGGLDFRARFRILSQAWFDYDQ